MLKLSVCPGILQEAAKHPSEPIVPGIWKSELEEGNLREEVLPRWPLSPRVWGEPFSMGNYFLNGRVPVPAVGALRPEVVLRNRVTEGPT